MYLAHAVQRSPRRARLIAVAVLVALAVLALVWIGRASADEGGPNSPDVVDKAFSNVATGRADVVDVSASACTPSAVFTDMPGMSETFSFGGNPSRPVIVLFQAEWETFGSGAVVVIRLTIDGIVQSGAATVVLDHRGAGEPDEVETHGFNFVSDPLAPGTHTAKIQWRHDSQPAACSEERSMIVLHK